MCGENLLNKTLRLSLAGKNQLNGIDKAESIQYNF